MADLESVDAYLEDKPEASRSPAVRGVVERCGPSEPAPRSSIVYWKRERVFAGAFVERRGSS